MGHSASFQLHKLFVAALVSTTTTVEEARALVEERFGPIDRELPPVPFTFSTYYDREMGPGLRRMLLSIGSLVDPSRLADFKEAANEIEQRTARPDGGRTLNLDPGLLSLSRVILATTKGSAHRIPLRDGFYCEITLIYRHGRYAPLEWTYPDYQSGAFVEWLGEVRCRYHEQLREIDASRSWRL